MTSDTMPRDDAPLTATPVSRRGFLHAAGALGALAALDRITPAYAQTPSVRPVAHSLARAFAATPAGAALDAGLPALRGGGAASIDLAIGQAGITVHDRRATAVAVNGTVPGPLLRLREGEDVTIHVTNRLREDASIHWHGLIVPNPMDGVPGVNYEGIRAGSTFTYQFPVRQYGTYWYHSHSGFQEQTGLYGPLIIDPAEPEPFAYDREYVVMLSDWTFEDPYKILDHIKKQSDYYNYQRRTVGDFFKDVGRMGLRATVQDRLAWGRMRMSPVDISDVTGATYTYLMNGRAPASNWTGLYRPGERVRLRLINAGSGTHFDFRIPGLEMTVVAVHGLYVKPVATDEIRIANAETYDVIVQPQGDRAYTLFAESADRSGYTRGTLAPREGMSAAIPARRKRPTLTMADMGMEHDMGGMTGKAMEMPGMQMNGMDMKGHERPGMPHNDATPPKDAAKGTPNGAAQGGAASAGQPAGHQGHDMAGMAGMAGMSGMAGMQMSDSQMPDSGQAARAKAKAPADTAMRGMAGHDMPGMGGHDMAGHNMGGKPAAAAPQAATASAGMTHGGQHGAAAGGMAGMAGMSGMGEMDAPAAKLPDGSLVRTENLRAPGTIPPPVMHGPDNHGPGNASKPMTTRSRVADPGPGLGDDGWRVLTYADLRALTPYPDATKPPTREIEIHLTGNMERYMWSINGIKFSDDPGPIQFALNERVRLTMVNDTMMSHPMHLHGMWMELENGHGAEIPRLHTINVKPAERVSALITADAPGPWAFHCHILYHMESGMMRVVQVGPPTGMPPATMAMGGGS